MKRRTGTFEEFKEHTLAIARGERTVEPDEVKVWCEPEEISVTSGAGRQPRRRRKSMREDE